MKNFLIKVITKTNYKDAQEFADRLEDLIPWLYNLRTHSAEENQFKDFKVVVSKVSDEHKTK